MNSGLSSYSNVAQKGIKTRSKQSFRSEAFANASWNETSTTSQDWFSLPPNEENISPSRNLLAFRAIYKVDVPWKVINEDDDMALGEARRNGREVIGKRVLRWLASLDECSIDKPESIDFIDAYSCVNRKFNLNELAEIAKQRNNTAITKNRSRKDRLDLGHWALPIPSKKIKERVKPRKFIRKR